ncbi:hypothetical protein [Acutalibacter muris]|uniref:hypothetical protein n=1 Tax=Acutalibacter muris TaxID=1796620 RepID=UPI001C3EC459|nr:hypothetical protein [Acutalibacter muris]
MKNQVIDLDESEVREVWPVPVMHTGCWTFTMEACLLTGELEKAVCSVFITFPETIQHALTFNPSCGGWADRARFWQTVLKLSLPPEHYHATMRKFLAHYTWVLRRRRKLCQYDLPSEQGFMREVGQCLCEWYRMGAAGEPSPFMKDFETELRALSAQAGEPLEQAFDTPGIRRVYQLGRTAYEDGAKLRSAFQERRLPG